MTAVLDNARRYHIPAFALTMLGAVLLPVIVHLLPNIDNIPTGARLLPMFIAPLVAIYLAHPAVGVAAALLAPALNNLLTTRPAGPMLLSITVELLVFALIIGLVRLRWPKFPVIAPIAYILARVVALLAMAVFQGAPLPSLEGFFNGLLIALPGILLLLLVNVLLVRRDDAASA